MQEAGQEIGFGAEAPGREVVEEDGAACARVSMGWKGMGGMI